MSVRTSPAAEAELAEQLEAECRGLGPRFLAAVRHALDPIERLPRMYPEVADGVPGVEVRNTVLSPFRLRLIYVVLADDVAVAAVVHTSRRDRLWHDRLPTL